MDDDLRANTAASGSNHQQAGYQNNGEKHVQFPIPHGGGVPIDLNFVSLSIQLDGDLDLPLRSLLQESDFHTYGDCA